MASQAAIFADTIAGMKRAAKRKPYDSDSDSSEIEQLTNRGNKLKRRSRFVHEGQLAPPTGPHAYRKKVEHAGYYRDTISTNPILVDEDGYELDSDDEDETVQAAVMAAGELDPYAGVKVEELLMPLTAASELPNHPTLSKPFLSNTLSELTRHAGDMVQKEKASLWRIKHLLTRLSGDSTWIPCVTVEVEDDINLFFDEKEKIRGGSGRLLTKDTDQASTGTLVSDEVEVAGLLDSVARATQNALDTLKESGNKLNGVGGSSIQDNAVAPNRNSGMSDVNGTTDAPKQSETLDEADPRDNGMKHVSSKVVEEVENDAMEVEKAVVEAVAQVEEDTVAGEPVDMDMEDADQVPAPRRMRTRAQAQAASDNATSSRTRSVSPDFNNDEFIHPYFLAPRASHPDRDVGLPSNEAEETRRLLQLYIQKQEEVCRGAQKIYEGLLKADRYRKLVMKWSKAEGHVGANRDMSDGEDWYDKEEWGLDEDLKKGQDEEEEDAATTAKKTRTRRQ